MSLISPATKFLLSLSMLKGVGPAALKKASLVPNFFEMEIEDLASEVFQIAKSLSSGGDWQNAQNDAARQIDQAERHLARIISPIDDEYPRLLAATRDDPFILYVKGSLGKTPEHSVAIIGTREPTMHGEVVARRITQFFAEQGWSIVSGLAIGCDAIAHQSALESGAHTVAVMAHGLQMIAPARHKNLAQDIVASGGALVSEYPFGQNVQNQQYVKRDRTQAGMARGVVMVQSDLKGGSLHASRAALDYGRWLAVPYPTDKDRESGEAKVQANLLMADGADSDRASLLRCPKDSLRQLIILRSKTDYLRMLNPTPNDEAADVAGDVEAQTKELQFSFDDRPHERNQQPTIADESGHVAEGQAIPQRPDILQDASIAPTEAGRLILTRDGFKNLKIFQYRALVGESLKARSSVADARVMVVAARLQYLQLLLDDLRDTLSGKNIHRERGNDLFLGFFLENFLVQMKRTVEIAVSVGRGSHGGSQAGLSEPSQRPPKKSVKPKPEEFLRETLAKFEESILRTIDVPARNLHAVSSDADADKEVENGLYLDDLVLSFNQVIAKQLPADL
ncbi:DNA-processing protein DprA [Rhizobium sp. Leaf453]|uniref:DNA-processing protein DprA n=1 Tax=Rhizobium sp. Leaf453 TaxID=1736380 RepID=UPI0009E8028E|nr:DNA-processing protein DprA [Rhizobium sp. Leaf453]